MNPGHHIWHPENYGQDDFNSPKMKDGIERTRKCHGSFAKLTRKRVRNILTQSNDLEIPEIIKQFKQEQAKNIHWESLLILSNFSIQSLLIL